VPNERQGWREPARHRQSAPALRAAGIRHRRIYDLRHIYATWSLATGVDLFTLSQQMGISLAVIATPRMGTWHRTPTSASEFCSTPMT
jgi:integrase